MELHLTIGPIIFHLFFVLCRQLTTHVVYSTFYFVGIFEQIRFSTESIRDWSTYKQLPAILVEPKTIKRDFKVTDRDEMTLVIIIFFL